MFNGFTGIGQGRAQHHWSRKRDVDIIRKFTEMDVGRQLTGFLTESVDEGLTDVGMILQ